jgi:small subunit ribosomal protein S8
VSWPPPGRSPAWLSRAGEAPMSVNDPIGDLIARIKNAAERKRSKVSTPASKLRGRVLDVLQDEGYIRGYALVERPGAFPEFEIELKYFDGQPVIVEIARVSKPGRRVYSSIGDLKPVKNGLGISILSTSKGVMSDAAARDQNVGGEVLCRVY